MNYKLHVENETCSVADHSGPCELVFWHEPNSSRSVGQEDNRSIVDHPADKGEIQNRLVENYGAQATSVAGEIEG